GTVELTEDGGDAVGAMDVLHVEVAVRGHLAHSGDATADGIYVGEREVELALLRGGQDVQHRVGGAAHGDVEGHGVLEGVPVGDVAGQRRRVVVLGPAAE